MLSNVLTQLDQIENASGRNDKIKLLTKFLKDPVFKGVVTRTLNSDCVYHIKALKPFTQSVETSHITDPEYLFQILDNLNAQPGANSYDKSILWGTACSSQGTYEVVKRILNKDLKCGVGAKSINAALPGTVYYVPYCRCSTSSAEGKFWSKPGIKYAQLKEDGMFVNAFHEDTISFTTRNGKTVHQLDRLAAALEGVRSTDTVYTGELIIIRDGVVQDRQTGNGILNSLIHGTANQEDADSVAIRIWDAVPIEDFWLYECTTPYTSRFQAVKELVYAIGDPDIADFVYTEEIKTKEDAEDFYLRMRAQGEEGSVLKSGKAIWSDHTSPNMIKKKNESSCALRITGWKYGKEGSKYKDVMGAIFCESECGKLKVTVNGKTDEMRGIDWDSMVGTICTVLFEYVTTSKSNPNPSLFLPRYSKPRPDREAADTLETIIERSKVVKS